MTTQDHSPARDALPFRDAAYAVRSYLGGRRGLLVLASVVVIAGLAMNWSWLVAAGIAPILIAAAPCAVMCALGLCISRMTGQSCAAETTDRKTAEAAADPAIPAASAAVAARAAIRRSKIRRKRGVTHA